MGRAKFLESEDRDMWRFILTELKKKNTSAKTPCGNSIWEKFITLGKSDRTPSNLSSHFRKKMYGNLHVASLKLEEKIYIYKSLDIKIDSRIKFALEAAHNVKLKFRPFSQIPIGYEKADNEEDMERDADVLEVSDDDSIRLDENLPGGSKDNRGNARTAGDAEKNRGTPYVDSVLDPDASLVDPEDHDYTREIREVKAQCRVRHGFPKVLDDTQLEDGEQPKKRRNTGTAAAPIDDPDQDIFDSSFESPREMEMDLDIGLVVHQPAPLSAELQDGQHVLMMDENEIPSTASPRIHQSQNGDEDVSAESLTDDSADLEFRSKFRKKLFDLCKARFEDSGDGLAKEITLLEAGIYKKAKSYEEYKGAMLKQVKMFASTAETFRCALSDNPPSTASNPSILLTTVVETKIDAAERKTAVLRMISQFEKFPTFHLAAACDFIKAAERCAALQAVDKKDYEEWMKTFDSVVKDSLKELLTERTA